MRWIGLCGTALLAVAAWLAGALPTGDPGAGLRTGALTMLSGSFGFGLACWAAGAALLGTAWVRLAATPAAHSTRWLASTAAWWVAPLLVAPALGSSDIYAYGCQGWLWWHGADPYAVGAAAGGCPWADSVPQLWRDAPAPYGPLALLISGLAAAPGSQLAAVSVLRLAALAGAVLLVVSTARLSSALSGNGCAGPRRAVLLGAVTPLVLVHGVSGAHHDLLMAALIMAALAVAVRPGGPAFAWLAGALLAGALAIKITAIVAVPFVLILAAHRVPQRWRWLHTMLAGMLSYAGLALVTGLGPGWIGALRSTGELAQWSSPPTAVGMTVGYLLRLSGHPEGYPAAIAVARLAALVILAGLGIAALRLAWTRRRHALAVVSACALLLTATALLGPVFYPWYALTPLAVLAVLPARQSFSRPIVAGTVGSTVAITLLTLPNGLGVPVLTKAPGAVLMTAAVLAGSWWAIRLWRRRGGPRTQAPAPGA